ncbi:MAG: hypothetical protein EOP87_14180 [Verrucomicrobiaceae bacterium]|nr:MAG: hypothetical protein EOP87_14180 [Verrucomicrobiaceae bacterium]
MKTGGITLSLALASLPGLPASAFELVKDRQRIQSDAITEASGMAVSPKNGKFLWIVNDSGSKPSVHLIQTDGTKRGSVRLKDVKNKDWEDLASFTLKGKSYLLVADTGDNDSKRESCTLWILREPDLPEEGADLDTSVMPGSKIEFKYEDGPRDCESVAVDEKAGKILLISKRTKPPLVYQLPLVLDNKRGTLIARKVGSTGVKCPVVSLIPFRDQPTGLDISADGTLAAAVTYYGVFLFPKKPAESWADAFARQPTVLAPHHLALAESVALSKDGKSIFVISEGKNSPIVRYQDSPEAPPP